MLTSKWLVRFQILFAFAAIHIGLNTSDTSLRGVVTAGNHSTAIIQDHLAADNNEDPCPMPLTEESAHCLAHCLHAVLPFSSVSSVALNEFQTELPVHDDDYLSVTHTPDLRPPISS